MHSRSAPPARIQGRRADVGGLLEQSLPGELPHRDCLRDEVSRRCDKREHKQQQEHSEERILEDKSNICYTFKSIILRIVKNPMR